MYIRSVLIGLLFLLVSCGSDASSDPKALVDSAEELSSGDGSNHAPQSGSSSRWHRSSGSHGSHSHGSHDGSSSSYVPPDVLKDDSVVTDTTTVQDVNQLPACTAANEGETFMVDSEKSVYFCVGGQWIPYEMLEQVYTISCKNGVLTFEEPSVAAAPGDGYGGYGGFGGYGGSSTTTSSSLDTAEVRIPAATIVGVAEKGPFRFGASVKLTELDSVKRLAETRYTHTECIKGADGSYKFEGVDLLSPYLLVEAEGVFRSELKGGLSSSPIKLKAIVDVTDRDTVNVNMLTHMEAPRVQKLVEDSGNNKPIRSVKAQSLREILSSFNISLGGSSQSGGGGGYGGFGGWGGYGQQQQTTTTTDGRFAEDVNLFDGDEYSAALLAISIMMQRKGSGNEMLQYASGIAERIKGNGNWDDNNAKADLADWLMILDTSGTYEFVRQNVASWNLGPVPDFEKHLRNFWTNVYQFGTCNSMTAGTVKYVNNSLSKFFVSYYEQPDGPRIRFTCDKETHLWRAATDIEKDTVGFGAGEYVGQIKNGKINTDKSYVYDQTKRSWREATADDITPFEDIADVLASVKTGEKVIFVLRHAERTDDTGKNGHLTDNGKKQSQSVGEKLKGQDIVFANSTYTRSKETAESFAKGAGMTFTENTIEDLDGEWFVKNDTKFENYKNSDGGGWVVTSAYVYKAMYSDAFYDFDSRGEEFMTTVVKPRFSEISRIGVWISHDMLVMPLAAYGSNKKVNLRYFDTKQWINYLAGLAIILGTDGKLRYVPVKGLSSGTMTM